MKYVRIRSWHIISTWTRVPGRGITRCGRTVVTMGTAAENVRVTAPFLPTNEKSCETCLRLTRHDEETA